MSSPDERPPNSCDASGVDIAELASRPIQREVGVFSTLGSETRFRILRILVAADDAVCGCELEPHLDVGQSTVSQSLSRLRREGLVSREKDGRWRYYEATPLAERLVAVVEEGAASERTASRA